MPSLSFSRPRHGLERVLLLGMNITPGGPDIAVAGQILEREDIHVVSMLYMHRLQPEALFWT
jgi:hypothetical protein